MTVSIWQANGTQPQKEVDFLIIGAGLAGCSAAYFARQAGFDVVITEKADAGLGASSRNAGFMLTGLDLYYHRAVERYGAAITREIWELSRKTHQYWHTFIKNSNGAVPFNPCGSMLLSESQEEARELELAARAMEADGHEIIFHTRDPLERGFYNAIEQPYDGAVQPYKLVRAILQQSGATLISNNEVYRIEQESAELVTVYTRQFIFRARYVMLCANACSFLVNDYFTDRVIPTRAQCIVTEPLEKDALDTCGYSNYGYMYYRMTFDGRLLVGGGRKNFQAMERNTTEDRLSAPVQQALENYLRERFPEVSAPVDQRWAGIMGFSVDGLPLVGTLPHQPRVGFAVGFTGHGLSLAAGTTERAVDFLINNSHPGPISAERFH